MWAKSLNFEVLCAAEREETAGGEEIGPGRGQESSPQGQVTDCHAAGEQQHSRSFTLTL